MPARKAEPHLKAQAWLHVILIVGAFWASKGLGGSTNVTQSILSFCTQRLLDEVDQTYNRTSSAVDRRSKLTTAVETFARECIGLQVQEERALRIMAPKTPLLLLLQQRAVQFEAATGIRVSLNAVEFFEVGREIKQELVSELNDFSDGWVLDPAATGEIASLEGFKSLDEYIPEDPTIEWNDISRFFRTASAIYDRKVVALPLDGDLMLMYFRRDLFDRYNLSVPQTWDEFVDLAVRMNGTDTDGDGAGDLYGACFDVAYPVCKANFLATAIAAPYIQYMGTSQGVFYDPVSMHPLTNNAAMARAVRHYVDLFAVLPPKPTCSASNEDFHHGHCLMTINWGDEFKANAPFAPPEGLGSKLSVAPLPGAAEVLDRSTGRLVACSGPEMCPYAKLVKLANGTTAYVNFAPYSAFGGWAGAVSRLAPADYQRRAYRFFAFLVQPNNSWAAVLDPTTSVDPYRRSQLQVEDGSNFERWIAAGYDRGATYAYLTSTTAALESGNMVLDSRLEFVGMPVRLILEAGLHNLTWFRNLHPNATVASTLASMEQQVLAGLAATGTVDELRRQYCKLIGCTASPEPLPPETDRDGSNHALIAVYVAVPVCVTLIIAVSALVMWRRHTHRRYILSGGIKAPGPGAATTIMITDIEASTALWEVLPEEVMGKAVEVHHNVVRRSLAKFSGYESATEGDSFICAFHSASEAVQCAMWIQQELVTAPWLPQLLSCAECPAVAELSLTPGSYYCELMAILAPRGGGSGAGGGAGSAAADKEPRHDKSRIGGVWRRWMQGGSEPVTSPSAAPAAAAAAHSPARQSQSQSLSLSLLQMLRPSSTPTVAAEVWPPTATAAAAADCEPTSRALSPHRIAAAAAAADGLAAVNEGEVPGNIGALTDEALANSNELPYYDDGGAAAAAASASRRAASGGMRSMISYVEDTLPSTCSALQSRTTLVRVLADQVSSLQAGDTGRRPRPRLLIDYVMAAWRPAADAPALEPVLTPGLQSHEPSSLGGTASTSVALAAAALMTAAASTAPPPPTPSPPPPPVAGAKGPGSFWRQSSGASRPRRNRGTSRGPLVRVYRGLRVRIGMASGVPEPTDVSYNAAEARYHYSGAGMRLARAVQGAAAGGMVLLSDSTFAQQREECGAELPGLLLLHMGQHDLHRDLPPQQVYQAISQNLAGRLAYFPPLVVRRCLTEGVLTAPVRLAAIAFVYAVGASALLAWDAAIARQALAELEREFARQLARSTARASWAGAGPGAGGSEFGGGGGGGGSGGGGGYIVEATGGLLLAAFSDPSQAVTACLATVEAMPELEWPEALLENALCEELAVARVDEAGAVSHEVLFRGLRIKAGLDYGSVHATINGATGRLSYRGRVMNRAARIASSASSGQVLCSRDLYDTASVAVPGHVDVFTAISIGPANLKGLPEPVELMLCRTATRTATHSRRLSVALRTEQQLAAAIALGLDKPQGIPTPRASISMAPAPELAVRLAGRDGSVGGAMG